jgi:hypothetical protein
VWVDVDGADESEVESNVGPNVVFVIDGTHVVGTNVVGANVAGTNVGLYVEAGPSNVMFFIFIFILLRNRS